MRGTPIAPGDQTPVPSTATWAAEYYQQQALDRRSRSWKSLLKPSVLGACLAVAGRVVFGPLALVLLFVSTEYFTDGTVFIKADHSFFSFTERDMSLAGGCSACLGPCKIGLLKYTMFKGNALTIAPTFNAFAALSQSESLYDFSSLSSEALKLAEELDTNGAVCQSGISDWGSTYSAVTGTPQQVLDVIVTLNISVAPQMIRELEIAIHQADKCVSTWNMIAIGRLFQYPLKVGDSNFGKVAAVDLNVFPDWTECRPVVNIDDSLVGSKLVLDTNGEDVVAVVPEVLTLFPYIFTSSLPVAPREIPASNTKYGAKSVVQPLLRGYYGGCRVRAVNTTGIFIETSCEVSKHWEPYGLMLHSPDDIPLCSTGDVCVRNYYNSNWEWVNGLAVDSPGRTLITANTFRSRYADSVRVNVLPGLVVTQILLMGLVSLYQVTSHKRSVLLTQIWAYRCQMGRMQVVYLAQILYHLVTTSDLYLLGLATGTLTTESIANLTCCFFVFSYSFINLAKARSGEQQLDRHFRLTWEAMQIVITVCVGSVLVTMQRTPLVDIITQNAEILRKATPKGAKFCGLNDACVLFKINMPTVVTIVSVGLGLVAIMVSLVVKIFSPKVKSTTTAVRCSLTGLPSVIRSTRIAAFPTEEALKSVDCSAPTQYSRGIFDNLTSFEENCIGAPFRKLFHDCDDIAYVTYRDKRCTTVEALVLTGYLYYGEHIYPASSVVLLVIARTLPQKFLRTFNVLLLRWYVDPKEGTISHPLSCIWHRACEEKHWVSAAVPLA